MTDTKDISNKTEEMVMEGFSTQMEKLIKELSLMTNMMEYSRQHNQMERCMRRNMSMAF